jgi:hypothetical protein
VHVQAEFAGQSSPDAPRDDVPVRHGGVDQLRHERDPCGHAAECRRRGHEDRAAPAPPVWQVGQCGEYVRRVKFPALVDQRVIGHPSTNRCPW